MFAWACGPRRLDGRSYVHATPKSVQDLHMLDTPLGAHLMPLPWQKSQALAILRRFLGTVFVVLIA